jgi:hypothetical protein
LPALYLNFSWFLHFLDHNLFVFNRLSLIEDIENTEELGVEVAADDVDGDEAADDVDGDEAADDVDGEEAECDGDQSRRTSGIS